MILVFQFLHFTFKVRLKVQHLIQFLIISNIIHLNFNEFFLTLQTHL